MRIPELALLAALLPALGACSSPSYEPGSPAPEFALDLYAKTADGRQTYFEIGRDGELRYGGGRSAVVRSAKPVLMLTDQQRQQVWDIITTNRLHEASGVRAPEDAKVNYIFALHTAALLGRTVRGSDDAVPGLEELHALLFEMQAKVRYRASELE